MKSKLVNQLPSRTRVRLTTPEKSITSQEDASSLSMASIKAKLEKGIPPTLTNDLHYSLQPMKFQNLQDAISFQQEVTDLFNSLPTEVRKGMQNNINNFESYVADPKNAETLQKHGLLQIYDKSNSDVVSAIQSLENVLKTQSKTSPDAQKPA